jgi:hypothetical protein
MNKLILKTPINNLSFGNVAYNFIKSLVDKEVDLCIFPVSNKIDLSAFNVPPKVSEIITKSIEGRYSKLKSETPMLNIWHINQAENKISERNFLYTFHETSESTLAEENICKTYDGVFFSSEYSASIFSNKINNCTNIPLGFDKEFHLTNKNYLRDKIHFGLMGKWENRKHTQKIIQLWLKKYGNNSNYQLTCCVDNPFLSKQEMIQKKNSALKGENYHNINFLPFMPRNAEVNDYLNSIDIDLGGLSGAEGWNLPSFNATCLGKWSIVLNQTAHKDWASDKNCILVEPDDSRPIYDNSHFVKGLDFNQGNHYTFNEEQFNNATEKAVSLVSEKTTNEEGFKLQDIFTYDKTIDKIIDKINI